MTVERHTITDRASWLAMRHANVGASEVAALFGCHPYQTALGLYVEKTGSYVGDQDSPVLQRGRVFESAVAEAIREQHPDWQVEKASVYLRDPDLRLGATPDFYVRRPDRPGRGVLQTKTLAPSVAAQWDDGTAPLWITLQALTEAMLEGADYAVVGGLVIDAWKPPVPKTYDIDRHAAAEAKIADAVAEFWARVERGEAPPATFGRDGATLAGLHPAERSTDLINVAGDNRLPTILDERAQLKATIKAAENRCDEIDDELKARIGDAAGLEMPGWRVTWKAQTRKETVIPAKTSRVLRVSERRSA